MTRLVQRALVAVGIACLVAIAASASGQRGTAPARPRIAIPAPESCESPAAEIVPEPGDVHVLAPGRYLTAIQCRAGAYQPSQMFFVWDTTAHPPSATPIAFDVLDADPVRGFALERTLEIWGHTRFNAAARELLVWNRFRAPGDCGVFARYRVGRSETTPIEVRVKSACDGRGAEHPERWPSVDLKRVRQRER